MFVWHLQEIPIKPDEDDNKVLVSMSERISEIIDVIESVREDIGNDELIDIRIARIKATNKVAKMRGIKPQSVQDKYTRKINLKTNEFNDLLQMWLLQNSNKLQELLLKNTNEPEDIEKLNDYFANKMDSSERLIAYEFGFEHTNTAFREGKNKLVTHLRKERNRQLVKQAKELWIKKTRGNVKCSICKFSFNDTYPEVSKDYIEAHHLKPISELEEDTIISIGELVPVCANCHRMLHHVKPWLTIDELKEIINSAKKRKQF